MECVSVVLCMYASVRLNTLWTLCLQVILLTFIYLVVWVCFTVLYSMITTVYIQLNLACKEYDDSRDLGDTCTHLYTASEPWKNMCLAHQLKNYYAERK